MEGQDIKRKPKTIMNFQMSLLGKNETEHFISGGRFLDINKNEMKVNYIGKYSTLKSYTDKWNISKYICVKQIIYYFHFKKL
jgi:hypothetical protein